MLSRDNKLIKNAVKLKQKKYRETEDKFIVEGIRFIEEAIKEKCIDYILYSEKLLAVNDYKRIFVDNVDKYEVSDDVIKELCDTENPQGAVAIANKFNWSFKDIKNDFVLIIDGVQDPGNLGTIIRTSDAAGLGGIFIIKGTVDVFNSKTLRSTMGSIFHIPILFSESFEKLAEELKGSGYNIYGSSLETDKSIYDSDFKQKTAIIIGNEANGVPSEHLNASTHKIKIPMPGKAESLNAANAAAILIYEVIRQRRYL